MKSQINMILIAFAFVIFNVISAVPDYECGEGAILFHHECYLIKQGNCPAASLLIHDKCCRENCVRTCTAENCWHCCESSGSSSSQTAVLPCNGQNNCQGNKGVLCNQCCCQVGNCAAYTCCNTGSSCCPNDCNHATGCQQVNCCGSSTPCNAGGCTPCSNNCQQANIGACPNSGCIQSNGQQPNCGNCQGGGQQVNCGGSSNNQGCNQGCCKTPCNQGNCQQTNNVCKCNDGNNPISTTVVPPTNPTSSPTIPSTPSNPPPASLECPPGTLPMGHLCRPLYCPKGTIMRNNECIILICPTGTVWNGYRCTIPQPITQNITFVNTVITNNNETKQDIVLNSYNNVNISLPIVINDSEIICEGEKDQDCDLTTDEAVTVKPIEPSVSLPPMESTNTTKCCTVMTPRTCEQRNSRWYCYSRRYQRCGEFCVAPVIYLRPPRVYTRPSHVVMPPMAMDCNGLGDCGSAIGGYDCSGCGKGIMATCSQYCYRYSCPSQRCGYFNQQTYCMNYPGSYGCMEDDGCFDEEWCS